MIEESQFSMVVCGWDDTKWTTYAFESRGQVEHVYVEDSDDEETDTDSIEENDHVEREAEDGPNEDVIASVPGRVIFVNPPIENPRRYWLIVVESQLRMATDEWSVLVDKIEESIRKAVRLFPHTSPFYKC
jgi:hypothetical protein